MCNIKRERFPAFKSFLNIPIRNTSKKFRHTNFRDIYLVRFKILPKIDSFPQKRFVLLFKQKLRDLGNIAICQKRYEMDKMEFLLVIRRIDIYTTDASWRLCAQRSSTSVYFLYRELGTVLQRLHFVLEKRLPKVIFKKEILESISSCARSASIELRNGRIVQATIKSLRGPKLCCNFNETWQQFRPASHRNTNWHLPTHSTRQLHLHPFGHGTSAGRCTRKLGELLQGTKCANERPMGWWVVWYGWLSTPTSPPNGCDFGPVVLCVVEVK